MVVLFSFPGDAGFLIITFPTSSTMVGKPNFSPKAFAKAIKMAVKRDLEKMILPSTKGML